MRMLNSPNTAPATTPLEAPRRFSCVVNQVHTIALKYPTGKLYPSRFPGRPDQVMYSLTDGRVMWMNLEVARLIDNLALTPGESFTLCNRGTRRGWEVRRANEPAGEMGPFAPINGAEIRMTAAPSRSPKRNGYSQEHTPAAAPAAVVTAPMTRLEGALKTAIAAAVAAERFAAELNHPVHFDAEAIRAMAITLVIQAEGGRR